ncbi:MAG TPA: Smr/MutS family protein [Saprospiraceae bacterium]|nr:Smr/MutS family protein [Saprospiraceae bacterium]
MDVNNYWIGDWVLLKKSGRIGKYEGLNKEGKAIVKLEDKKVYSSLKNIEPYHWEEAASMELNEWEDERPKSTFTPLNLNSEKDRIDLHIDQLNPAMKNALPAIILEYQIRKCRSFLKDALNHREKIITIIHGKGNGVLREAVHHVISEFPEVRFTMFQSDGGSTEVWFY